MPEPDLEYLHPQLRPLAVRVDSLTPDPKNARKRDQRAFDAVKRSIKESGFRSVIIVQRAGDQLVVRAGNGRHRAMVELGYEYIPALIFDEGDDAAVKFAIADNRTAELAEWDFEVLGEHLRLLDEAALEHVGFTRDEADTLLANNDWGGFDFDAEESASANEETGATGETPSGPKHEQDSPKIVIKVSDPTCRVELLRAVKELIAANFKDRAKV